MVGSTRCIFLPRNTYPAWNDPCLLYAFFSVWTFHPFQEFSFPCYRLFPPSRSRSDATTVFWGRLYTIYSFFNKNCTMGLVPLQRKSTSFSTSSCSRSFFLVSRSTKMSITHSPIYRSAWRHRSDNIEYPPESFDLQKKDLLRMQLISFETPCPTKLTSRSVTEDDPNQTPSGSNIRIEPRVRNR